MRGWHWLALHKRGINMNDNIQISPRMNPLMAVAAVSVIIVSMLGIAAITGVLPSANSQKQEAGSSASKAPAAAAVAGSASTGVSTSESRRERQRQLAQSCANCGTVEAVRTVELKGEGTGLGAVAGGVTGAVIGNQMGSGRGNTAMTVIGAAGGAFAGNEIEKNVKKRYAYRITVRMEDGTFRTVSQSQPPAVGVGDKVRVADGVVAVRS